MSFQIGPKKNILNEGLQNYARIYFDTIYYGGENCICIKKITSEQVHVCIIGERGRIVFEEKNLNENIACQVVLKYMRDLKFLFEDEQQENRKGMSL
ncbi:MAG: hypothetical protein V8T48_02305 [Oscillospiraceae bacterium]